MSALDVESWRTRVRVEGEEGVIDDWLAEVRCVSRRHVSFGGISVADARMSVADGGVTVTVGGESLCRRWHRCAGANVPICA
jgi:hypothetical protein